MNSVIAQVGGALLLLFLSNSTLPAAPIRVDLAGFARIVRYAGNSPETFDVQDLKREADGWRAYRGENGQYLLGLEWDEPRDIAEVSIEFAQDFPRSDGIGVEYAQQFWPSLETGGWAPIDDPFHGKWTTAKTQNTWRGERNITLIFGQLNEEPGREGLHGLRFRRTYRLRLTFGTNEPPAIRAVHAYAVRPTVEGRFAVRAGKDSVVPPPWRVQVVNGALLDGRGLPCSELILSSATNLHVAYLQSDVETQTRTVVTVRCENDPLRGFSFLPQEAQSRGELKIPPLGVDVAALDATGAHAPLQPGQTIMDRVEREPQQTFARARRDIPALRKSGQRDRPMYLPLGPPDARQEIAVSYDGSFLLHNSSLKSTASDSARMQWPGPAWYLRLHGGESSFEQSAEGAVRQRLLDGYLPIVISSWESGGIQYEETCVATFLNGEPAAIQGDETVVLLARLTMSNPGSNSATATVQLQTEPGERLQLTNNDVYATGSAGETATNYSAPRYRFWLSHEPTARNVPSPGATLVTSQWSVAPGESRRLELRVPFVTLDTAAERGQIAALDFDRVLVAESNRWQKIIAQQAAIEVPDRLLSDFYKASLAHILITGDRDPLSGYSLLSAGTFLYGLCLNEACHQIRSLEMRGLHQEAQKYLDAIIAGQSRMTLGGRFGDMAGALRGVRLGDPAKEQLQGGPYNLDHGFALWMLNEHYRFTRDQNWLRQNAPALIAACDFVTRERSQGSGTNTLSSSDARWGNGLLPPGQLEDPPDWLWWLSVNAYAARGMLATAESLKEINHPDAGRIARDASAYLQAVRDSSREAMLRAPVVRLRDGTYIPFQPTRSRLRGRDVGWVRDGLYGPVHLIDCGIYPNNSPEAGWILRDTEDNVFIGEERGRKLTDLDSQWFSWGGITIQANLLPNPLVYIRRDQPKAALRAFYNVLATYVYEDVRAFCEHPVDALGLGEGPFYKTPDESGFIVWLRSLLICENGPDLELLPAVPLEWLEDGKEIRVRGAATWFGPVGLHVACKDSRMDINVAGANRNAPGAIRLHLRHPESIRRIYVNGQSVSRAEMKAGVVLLDGKSGKISPAPTYKE